MTQVDPGLWDEEEISRDTLLSELAGALSRAIRHVIAPPTASWHGRRVALPVPAATTGVYATPGASGDPAHGEWRPRHTTAPPFAHHVSAVERRSCGQRRFVSG